MVRFRGVATRIRPLNLLRKMEIMTINDADKPGHRWLVAATDPLFQSQIGHRSMEGVHSQGKEGCLIYGPYIAVHAGSYLLTFHGSAGQDGEDGVVVDVCAGGGKQVLARAPVKNDRQRSDQNRQGTEFARLEFRLPQEMTDLEFRVWTSESSVLTVTHVELYPLDCSEINWRANLEALSSKQKTRIVRSLKELDIILKELDAAAAVSDDTLRRAFTTFSMEYPLGLPSDPYSSEYREYQLDFYEFLAGKSYSPNNEVSLFDVNQAAIRPFPFSTGSTQVVGDQLIAIGHLIRTLDLPQGNKILEFGPGWGNTTVWLASMGYRMTGVDIEQRFVDLIAERARRNGLDVEVLVGDFQLVHQIERQWDAVLFFECFHHCADHQALIVGLDRVVAPGGKIIFAAEPISDSFPIPWGFRLDGESLWAIRKNGWCELGFQESYFRDLMDRNGWRISKHVCSETPWGVVFVAIRK